MLQEEETKREEKRANLEDCKFLIEHVSNAYLGQECNQAGVSLATCLFDLLQAYIEIEDAVPVGPNITMKVKPLRQQVLWCHSSAASMCHWMLA